MIKTILIQVIQNAQYLLPIIISALLVYFLGLSAYKKQKQYEEIRDYYLRNGLECLHEEVSYYFSAFAYNYEVLQALLKNVRDFVPGAPVTFNDIRKDLKEYCPKGNAFRAIQRVAALINDDAITRLAYSLFGDLSAARIAYDEIYLAIGKFVDFPQVYCEGKREQQEYYEELKKQIEIKKDCIYEKLDLMNYLDDLINQINRSPLFYTSLSELQAKMKESDRIQRSLATIIWRPIIKDMSKTGIPIISFLGSFLDDPENFAKGEIRWMSFSQLVECNAALPCSYEEAKGSCKVQAESEKWKLYLEKKYNKKLSGAYKMNSSSEYDIDKLCNIVISDHAAKLTGK